MNHLKNRFTITPLQDLSPCPHKPHHAIGSPHFQPNGTPNFPDPIAIAIRASITNPHLPPCTILAASCTSRPYLSYGPVMKTILEHLQPHQYPNLRKGLEGVMNLGTTRLLEPGGLKDQCQHLLLGCVSPITEPAQWKDVENTLQNMAKTFENFPPGSTIRMPILGTGKAKGNLPLEQAFERTLETTLSLFQTQLYPNPNLAPKRLLLLHPNEYEIQLITSYLGKKAILLSILDKLDIFLVPTHIVYGIAYDPNPELQITTPKEFNQAIEHFDQSLNLLLQHQPHNALKEAAQAASIAPNLRGLYLTISQLAATPNSFLNYLLNEATQLAQQGKIADALALTCALDTLQNNENTQQRLQNLQEIYLKYTTAAIKARILYENYTEANEIAQNLKTGTPFRFHPTSHLNQTPKHRLPFTSQNTFQKIQTYLGEKALENTLHIIIRKLMAPTLDLEAPLQALKILQNMEKNHIKLPSNSQQYQEKLHQLIQNLSQQKPLPPKQKILEQLLEILPNHGTLQLEAGKLYLQLSLQRSFSKKEILQAWHHLYTGYQHHPNDYGILSFIGLCLLLQGGKFLEKTKNFFWLLEQLLQYELQLGDFSQQTLHTSPPTTIPITDPQTLLAKQYYQDYLENVQHLQKLLQAALDGQAEAAFEHYQHTLQSLRKVGRYDLYNLYELALGKEGIYALCRYSQRFGNIPIPFIGELPLDFLTFAFRKIKYWWKRKTLSSSKLRQELNQFLKELSQKIQNLS